MCTEEHIFEEVDVGTERGDVGDNSVGGIKDEEVRVGTEAFLVDQRGDGSCETTVLVRSRMLGSGGRS